MRHRGHLVLLPPNRVWRSYLGGRTLDALAGCADPKDSHLAEDWIGSVTAARNAGREAVREGVSSALIGGKAVDFKELLESDPAYFLGEAHVAAFGAKPMILVKFLDSAIRLHFQVHPTRDFARKHLGSDSGKTEAYYFLSARPDSGPAMFYLGFQRPPSPAELRRIVEDQDIVAMERCFDPIPVKPGDAYVIPGGVPHALGGGVFMVEIQEPTDLAVRMEFERGGYILPEAARFMGRGVDFGLSLIDFTPRPLAAVERDHKCRPRLRENLGPDSRTEDLIGPEQTPCFRVRRTRLGGPVARKTGEFHIGIVTAGSATAEVGGETNAFKTFDRFCVPAGLGAIRWTPQPTAEILECHPPEPRPC